MTQFCIIGFHRISIVFALRNFISAEVIPKACVGIEAIAVIPLGFWGFIDHLLDGFLGTFLNHDPS